MSRETHSIDQGKMHNQSENTSQAQLDQNKPKTKQCSLGQAKTHGVRTKRPKTTCWTKLGAVGALGRPTGLPGRLTGVVGRRPTSSNRPQLWYLGCLGVPCPNPMGHGLL